MTGTSEPFGMYGLTPWRESLRNVAGHTPGGKPGMWMISLLRKATLLGHETGMNGPLDVQVAPGVNARLFPGSNRCEKRAFAGVHIWDSRERAALAEAIRQSNPAEDFIFLDIGANVGLYSLFVNASVQAHKRNATIIAVEPDDENRARMMFNFEASNCPARVEAVGIAAAEGFGILTEAEENRGGIYIRDKDAGRAKDEEHDRAEGKTIKLETLPALIDRHGLTHIDAMKIDIEGRDEAALRTMLQQTPVTLWPRLLIAETGREPDSPVLKLMIEHGYRLEERTGINVILKFEPPQDS